MKKLLAFILFTFFASCYAQTFTVETTQASASTPSLIKSRQDKFHGRKDPTCKTLEGATLYISDVGYENCVRVTTPTR